MGSRWTPTPPPSFLGSQDEGTALPFRGRIDYAGSGVTATDDAANGRTVVTIPGAGGLTIADEGGSLTSRPTLNFTGSGVTASDDAVNNRTNVVISATGGGTGIYFNVKDYGAAGNATATGGGTDDTTAIQNAINAAQAVKGTVFFPAAIYRTTAALQITASSGVKLLGEWVRYSFKTSNRNWDCAGTVIQNGSTTTDAIIVNAGPRSGGQTNSCVIESLGISTPAPGGSGFTPGQSAGWGQLCTQGGITFAGGAVEHVLIRDVMVVRHYYGVDMCPRNSGRTSTGTTCGIRCTVDGVQVAVARRIGINIAGTTNAVYDSAVLNNDPEWTSSDALPARGDIGFKHDGEGHWVQRNLAISCNYGYFVDGANGYAGGYPTHYQMISDNFADACPYPYSFTTNAIGGPAPMTVRGNMGTACYWDPVAVAWYTGQTGMTIAGATGFHLEGNQLVRGQVALDLSACFGCTVLGGTGSNGGGSDPTVGLITPFNGAVIGGDYSSTTISRNSATVKLIAVNLGTVTGTYTSVRRVACTGVADG